MINLKAVLATGALALSPVLTLGADAALPKYEQIYIFGDSLSDTGNLFNLSSAITTPFPPSPFYTDGRFSNGPIWIDYLNDALGLDPTLYTELNTSISSTDGINFAVGGSSTDQAIVPFAPSGVLGQIDIFTDLLNGQPANPNALYIVWGGHNDYILNNENNPQEPVDNLATAITTLASAGARNILVGNLVDLSQLPIYNTLSPAVKEFYTTLSNTHNFLLNQKLNELSQTLPNTNLITLDINTLLQNTIDNPEKFGLTDVTSNCTGIAFPSVSAADFPGYLNCLSNNPDNFLFWDTYHLTNVGNQRLAAGAIDTLSVPEPGMIPALSLVGLWLFKRAVSKQSD